LKVLGLNPNTWTSWSSISLAKETQNTIFAKQLKKHISHKCPEVAVLSAFPVYVLDYYGVEGVKRKLKE